MAVLVDTNVLIFSIQHGHPWQEASIRAIQTLLAEGEIVCVLPQNIAEFWNVGTRPTDKNGLGLRSLETEERLRHLDRILTVLYDNPACYLQWRKFVVQHDVKGIQVHAARIAAAMQVHDVSRILTYNPRDFVRYGDIASVRPDAIT